MTATTTPDPPEPGLALPAVTADGVARRAALEAQPQGPVTPTSLVAYRSGGRLAIVGPREPAEEAAARLAPRLQCTLILPPGTQTAADAGDGVQRVLAEVTTISGHLGAFALRARADDGEVDLAPSRLTGGAPFDLVLDLATPPRIAVDLPPPGYYAPRDAAALERAIVELPEMVGEFEKPRFFRYDADICAHGARGLPGCDRCLRFCPTGAIASIGERVEVDPYLCQGGGVCAAACPTGAIAYAYPPVHDLLARVRRVLSAYRDAGGAAPVIVLHDGEAGREWLASHAGELAENVLPVAVEEVGSVGLDGWLAALAYGAAAMVVLDTPRVPAPVRAGLDEALGTGRAILEGLGYPAAMLARIQAGEVPPAAVPRGAAVPGFAPATFAAVDEKRTLLRLALDHLHAQAPAPVEVTPLPAGAPFGEIVVDRGTCTLCMACVAVCPARALAAGGETPALRFIEWNCVQCGLCETACPEDSIALAPRLLHDGDARMQARVLNEDRAFECSRCGKPFATASVIARMREKLSGHHMYREPAALARLEMCEDCRVKDLFRDGGGLLEP